MERTTLIVVIACVVLVFLAATVGIYLSVPEATGLLGSVGGYVNEGLDKMTGGDDRAAPVAQALNTHAPAELPARDEFIAACLAIYKHESGLDPTIFNWNDGGKYRVGHYPDDPHWQQAWAHGIAQLIWKYWGGAAGNSHEDLFDLDTNVRIACTRINAPHWKRIMAGVPNAPLQLRCALLYLGHGDGGGPMDTAIKAAQSDPTWGAMMVAVADRHGITSNSRNNMWVTGQNAPRWLARLPELA